MAAIVGQQALGWLALLVLGALQSPFAPGYVAIGLLWAITLMATDVRGVRGSIDLLLVWLLLTVVPPIPIKPLAVFSIVQMTLMAAAPIYLLVRGFRSAGRGILGAGHDQSPGDPAPAVT